MPCMDCWKVKYEIICLVVLFYMRVIHTRLRRMRGRSVWLLFWLPYFKYTARDSVRSFMNGDGGEMEDTRSQQRNDTQK